MHGQQNILKKR